MSIPKGGRSYAVERRVRPHVPIEDDAGNCTICNLPIAVKNALHVDTPPAAVQAHNAVERARLAETD